MEKTGTKTRKRIRVSKISKNQATQKMEKLLKIAEAQIKDLRARVAKIDKATAKSNLQDLRKQVEDMGLYEFQKARSLVEKKLNGLQKDFVSTSAKVKDTFEVIKQQVKNVTESERLKRRARRRS